MNPSGELYAKNNIMQERSAIQFFKEIKTSLNNTEKWDTVVEIGCGSGNVTKIFWETFNCGEILAFDKNESMIQFCNQNNSNPSITFSVANIEDEGEKIRSDINLESKADVVFSVMCLQWVKDKKKAMANINSLLKKDGKCYITFPSSSQLTSLHAEFFKNSHWLKYLNEKIRNTLTKNINEELPVCLQMYEPNNELVMNELEQILLSSGFREYNVSVIEEVMKFETIEQFVGTWTVIMHMLELIPEAKRQNFFDDFFDFIRSNVCCDDENNSGFDAHYKLIKIFASK